MSVATSTSTPCIMPFPYTYDRPATASAQPFASASTESVLPPAYAESQSSTFDQSDRSPPYSPPYSPRPLPRPPTSTIASVLSPVQSPRPPSAPVDVSLPYNDDLADPVLPPDDAHSFISTNSDSDDCDSEVTLHDGPLRPALELTTTKVLDSTLSPVDPECLSKLDLDLLLTPLDAWADVCYADSVLNDVASEEDRIEGDRGTPPRGPSKSLHAFASSGQSRYISTPHPRPSESGQVAASVEQPERIDDYQAPFSPDGCKIAPRTTNPTSPPPHQSPPASSPLPSASSSRPVLTLASPRPRRGFLSLTTIRSESPPTSESDADEESDGARADDEGDGGLARATDPHAGVRGWTPPRMWTGYEVWVPIADVEEKVTALHLDFSAARHNEKAALELEEAAAAAAVPHRVEFNLRPTSPVPGYPLLFSREPPNPADSVHFFPKREEKCETGKPKREKSLSSRVVGLFR
ncbi:hypothetical protein DAEQUDRAFT_736189 [Daedalea quercina L-15889]|uniref:Uncharacterized protein n=1 Tax=Daedalea quercina L-15889 TaxID=1314783 RepID=A0A165SSB3_9APHY|nr:hypothetical protein DAEQUDRAFT_736189 [Daedalea quercina L-15889]